MKRMVLCLVAVLSLGGCVSTRTVPATTATLSSHQGQLLTVVTYKKTDFVAMTQTLAVSAGLFGAVGGLVAGSIAVKNGNEIVQQNDIPDPALGISAKLSPMLQDALKAPSTKTVADVDINAIDPGELSKLAGNSGTIFDIQTLGWQFIYYPFSSHYRVIMVMRARLIDANTGERIAQAPCTYESGEDHPPTYDEMLADHASRLKAMLIAGANVCSDTIRKALVVNQNQ